MTRPEFSPAIHLLLPPFCLLQPFHGCAAHLYCVGLCYQINDMDTEEQKKDYNPPRDNGRIWGGLFLLFLGGIFVMKEASLMSFPHWLFTWPMILIAVGVFPAIKHGFRGGGWL